MTNNVLNESLVRSLSNKSNVPLVFRNFVDHWSIRNWTVEKWCSVFGDREIPFRCFRKDFTSDEPCWERKCNTKNMTFKQFVDSIETSEEWMYFDYKYVHQWFGSEDEIFKEVNWKDFGFPEKAASDTTLWIGSEGAHTPLHQDTYGVNIVAQLHGKKRWILFPPETGGLKPTRVPYEESSVYSELNLYCPVDLEYFKGLAGGRAVELAAGDALLVPRGWWHHVHNLEALNVTLNVWLPHEKDPSSHVSEALIKILVAQICKDLPPNTARLLINPTEDDLPDTPLTVLFLQLETVVNIYLDKRRKQRRVKRQRTCEDPTVPTSDDYDLKSLIENQANNLETVPSVSSEDIINILKQNLSKYADVEKGVDEDETDGSTSCLGLTKAVINAFSQDNVIDAVKQNLFAQMS